ncbi:sex peptide receptor-like [Tetranychus urticae]|uniref:G-protein coupled receptors family 1 profile domain-containing protein n=1 Tax=Tetranychus urticae TaxID=32264 RepID=T1K7Y1_TETUR|nr:sex peptide receptor-like [Tetranychus urticae]XP_015783783.1 sex peptide receptor-like [Tetranychus urticae]
MTTALTIDVTDAYTLSNSNTSIYLNVSKSSSKLVAESLTSSSLSSIKSSFSSLISSVTSNYKHDNQSEPVIINSGANVYNNLNDLTSSNLTNSQTNFVNNAVVPESAILSLLPVTLSSASASLSSGSPSSLASPFNLNTTLLVEPYEDQGIGLVVNVTKDYPLEYAIIMFGYIMPFLLIVTLITNSLVVIVLAQREMRTPTNLVLLAMAISDMLTLLFPSPWYFYNYTLGYHSKILHPPVACYAYHCMIEVIPAFFHTASIWLTLVLAGQRYIYVCHPTVAPKYCTPPKVARAIVTVFVLSLIVQASRFADRDFQEVTLDSDSGPVYGCRFFTATWVKRLFSEDAYYIFYYSFRIIFVNIGPCTALVILNLALFRALRRAQHKRKKLFQENRRSECKKLCDTNCTTLMLIVVVSVFLATEIPMAITTVSHVIQNSLDIHIASYEYLNLTILFSNFLIMLSYPFNFAIYCGMSRQFRETFKALFIPGGRSALSDRSRQTREGSTRYSVANGPRTSTNETVL